MAFNPFDEKGIAIDKQLRNWSTLNSEPYDRDGVHPYTHTRVILMNGIEVEGAIFGHQLARHNKDPEIRRQIAATRRIEQQQQKAVNWLTPASETVLELTIGYEQVAVDLTAFLARTEPDPTVKAALDFALLEDFDHLYRYANLMDMVQGKKAAQVTGKYTEIMPGRPTVAEHRDPFDDVRQPVDAKKADPLTLLHIQTIVAAEQQTMNLYMNVGNRPEEMLGRGLYLEIAQIEEQHVTHYESLIDPTSSWFERWALHEYNECWLYHSCMETETDPRIKRLWEHHLEMEVGHLNLVRELAKRHDKKDPAEMLPKELPAPLLFESNVDYVREVLQRQVHLTGQGTEYVPVDQLPQNSRYHRYQQVSHEGGVPSEQVIERRQQKEGSDYRQELAGPHPIKSLRR